MTEQNTVHLNPLVRCLGCGRELHQFDPNYPIDHLNPGLRPLQMYGSECVTCFNQRQTAAREFKDVLAQNLTPIERERLKSSPSWKASGTKPGGTSAS